MTDCLANPIWHSLSNRHSDLAKGNSLAKRYREDIGPLAGFPERTAECWEALKAIIPAHDQCVLFLSEAAEPVAGLEVVSQFPIEQMLCEAPRSVLSTGAEVKQLGDLDVPEMMSLASVTEPGPFRSRTIELGGYVGIRDVGRLVAMAGQRSALPEYREVSAVCTNPSYRRRGYASALICAVVGDIARRGELPYLHVRQDNISAIRLYRRLGFRITRTFCCTILRVSEAKDLKQEGLNF